MSSCKRLDGRKPDQLRPVTLTPNYIIHPEGSVLISFGDTKVICNASVENSVPPHCKDTGRGWITAEYSMLPRATNTRSRRDISSLKLSGRTAEIQRLIGRALRCVTDLSLLPDMSVTVDCDVIQADGGTRTAAITGGYVALWLAFDKLRRDGRIAKMPLTAQAAAVSLGVRGGQVLLDLCYEEDSSCDVDFNLVMTSNGGIIELQGTGEQRPFDRKQLDTILKMGEAGINELCAVQRKIIKL